MIKLYRPSKFVIAGSSGGCAGAATKQSPKITVRHFKEGDCFVAPSRFGPAAPRNDGLFARYNYADIIHIKKANIPRFAEDVR